MADPLAQVCAELERGGFGEIDAAPGEPGIRVGARVHNRAEQFHNAFIDGTATVVAVYRRGSDEHPDMWERRYGRPNVEVVVRHDRDGEIRCWADYGTWLAERQPEPNGQESGHE